MIKYTVLYQSFYGYIGEIFPNDSLSGSSFFQHYIVLAGLKNRSVVYCENRLRTLLTTRGNLGQTDTIRGATETNV